MLGLSFTKALGTGLSAPVFGSRLYTRTNSSAIWPATTMAPSGLMARPANELAKLLKPPGGMFSGGLTISPSQAKSKLTLGRVGSLLVITRLLANSPALGGVQLTSRLRLW